MPLTDAARFHEIPIAHVEPTTRDAIVVSFSIPPELRDAFRHKAGQYLTLRATIDGADVRRSYSICSGEDESDVRIAIKRVSGGVFSEFACDTFTAGTSIALSPPSGRFTHVPQIAQTAPHYLAFAAGSGITPIFAMLQTTLARERDARWTLVYGNRATASVMFREELCNLKDRYLTRLSIVHVLSRERGEIDLFSGRIDRAKCDALFEHWIDPSEIARTYICGPDAMADDVESALLARRFSQASLVRERFASPQIADTQRRARAAAIPATSAEIAASVMIDGRERAFAIAPGNETVLDAALRAGIEIPYSCKGGVCATCRAVVTEGDVEMDVRYGLEDYEVRRGLILTCQAYPRSKTLAIDVDAAAQT